MRAFLNRSVFVVFAFCILANCYSQTSAVPAAKKAVDSLKQILSKTSKPIDRFSILVAISDVGFIGGDTDSATCTELLQIAQNLKNDSLLAISYNIIGQYVSRVKSDNTTGLEYFFKAIPLAEASGDKRRLSSVYFDLAFVYSNLGNTEEFGNYTRKGGQNLPDTSHPLYKYMLAQYQRGMANYFVTKREPDSALPYATALLISVQQINSPLYAFNVYGINGAIQDQLGDKEMAALYFKKALAITEPVSANTQLRFADYYIPFLIRARNFPQAKIEATSMFRGLKADNNNFRLKGAGFLRQIYDSLHQSDSAYYYAKQEIELKQIIFDQNNANKIQSFAFNEQIRSINQEAKAKEALEERKQNIQYALIAIGILILLILYFALSRSFITNTRLIKFFGIVALLIVFEFLNLLLHPFLERITHHSPLLMLLAMVCIAALLVPLHHKIEHWATTKLIEKNRAIRLASAKRTIQRLEKSEQKS